jgi:putrescine transport system ATP-binding protein
MAITLPSVKWCILLGDLSIYHVRLKSGQMLSAQLQNEHRYRKGQPTWGDEVRLCWDATVALC